MENYFIPDRKKEYLIYGAGGGGLKVLNLLSEQSYAVLGFIDQRAPFLSEVQGKPVWNLNQVQNIEADKDAVVVIITTKNVFEHSNIALELAKKGFFHCIYKPLPILQNETSPLLQKVSHAHDCFLINICLPPLEQLPDVSLKINFSLRELCCIQKHSEEVTAWLPLELLFNYKAHDVYDNIPMACFFPLIDLYCFFEGDLSFNQQDTLQQFVSYSSEWARRNNVSISSDLVASWIKSRKKSFDEMQAIFERDFNFFIRNAPFVAYSGSWKFHLTKSGRNRVVFLAAKGFRYIPVKMSLSDYNSWYNKSGMQKMLQYFQENLIDSVKIPIPHPLLSDFRVLYPDFHKHISFPICKYVLKQLYKKSQKNEDEYSLIDSSLLKALKEKISFLCTFDIEGALCHFLLQQGYHVVFCGNKSGLSISYDNLLCQLFHLNHIQPTKLSSLNLIVCREKDLGEFSFSLEDIINTWAIICLERAPSSSIQLLEKVFHFDTALSRIYLEDEFLFVNVYLNKESLDE